MYGDPEVMRHRAGELREQATELRRLADRLVGQAETVPWTGRAAAAMRERIRDRAARLRDLAGGHDEAATLLDRHREEVERLTELIADQERRAGPDPTGRLPPAGHRDWLTEAGHPTTGGPATGAPEHDAGTAP